MIAFSGIPHVLPRRLNNDDSTAPLSEASFSDDEECSPCHDWDTVVPLLIAPKELRKTMADDTDLRQAEEAFSRFCRGLGRLTSRSISLCRIYVCTKKWEVAPGALVNLSLVAFSLGMAFAGQTYAWAATALFAVAFVASCLLCNASVCPSRTPEASYVHETTDDETMGSNFWRDVGNIFLAIPETCEAGWCFLRFITLCCYRRVCAQKVALVLGTLVCLTCTAFFAGVAIGRRSTMYTVVTALFGIALIASYCCCDANPNTSVESAEESATLIGSP